MTTMLVNPHTLRDEETGLLLLCSRCDRYAIAWGKNATPFCDKHWTDKWYMVRRERDTSDKLS